MDDVRGDSESSSAYEALVEFLYLAPVGIVKFRGDGTIDMANPTAAQLLMPLTSDGDMSDLYKLLHALAPDLRSHVERFQEPAGQIFDQMQLHVPRTGLTLMLDINKINDETMMAVIQNITDLTEARREVMRRTESQRLLASVFMRLSTPVVVTRADGFIVLTNAAFQTSTGYDAKSLVGLNIDALVPPDGTGVGRAARSQQMLDGGTYQTEMEVIAKDGSRVPFTLNSSVLEEAEARQLRVITFIPIARVPSVNQADALLSLPQSGSAGGVNQVKTIDLSAFKTAVGPDWQFIASRALTLVEDLVRPMLSPSDILKRSKDSSLIVWFSNSDPARNNAILARAMQGAHRVFLTEFGSKIADRVRAAEAA